MPNRSRLMWTALPRLFAAVWHLVQGKSYEWVEVFWPWDIRHRTVKKGESKDDRRKQRRRKKMSKGFIGALDEIASSVFDWNSYSKNAVRRFRRDYGPVNVQLSGEMLKLVDRYTDLDFQSCVPATKEAANLEKLDATFVTPLTHDDTHEPIAGGWVIHRVRRAGWRYCRTHLQVNIPGATWITHQMATTALDKGYELLTWYFTRDGGEHWSTCWVDGFQRYRIEPVAEDHKYFWCRGDEIRMAMYSLLLGDVAWKLTMTRMPLTFEINCNEALARELITLRDAETSRRKAALHWVQDHDRKIRRGHVTHVRAHLRGATQFRWGSWQCELRESEFDRLAFPDEKIPIQEVTDRARLQLVQ